MSSLVSRIPWDLLEKLAFYLIIFFLPTQLGLHFWPEFSYVSGIRIDYLSPTIFISDVLLVWLFAVWTLRSAIYRLGRRIQGYRILHLGDLWSKLSLMAKTSFLLWLLIVLVGIHLAQSTQAGWYGLFKVIEFILLGCYIALNMELYSKKILAFIFSLGILLESNIAFWQFFNQRSMGGIFYWLGERSFNAHTPGIANMSIAGELIMRPYGTLPHPNILAGYLVIYMSLLLQFLSSTFESFKLRLFYILSLFAGTIALALTAGRVAIIIWLTILVFMSFAKINVFSKKSSPMALLPFLLFLATIIGILVLSLSSRFFDISGYQEGALVRSSLTKSSIVMLRTSPFFGVGVNNFLINLPEFYAGKNLLLFQPVHNIFLLVAAETGILGLAFFILFLIKTYKQILFSRSPLGYLLILSGVLIIGFFDHYFITVQQGKMLFSLVIGLCWSKSLNTKILQTT